MKKIVLTALALMLILTTLCACDNGEATSSVAESSQIEEVSSTPSAPTSSTDENSIVAAKTDVTVQDLYGKPGEDTDYITFKDDTYTGLLPEYVLFTTKKTVTEVKFFNVSTDENGKTVVGEPLYTLSELTAENQLCVVTYINDVVPNKGVSFIEESGKERFFTIHKDFSNGRMYFLEIEA